MSSPRSGRTGRSKPIKPAAAGTSKVVYQTKHGSVIGTRSGIKTSDQADSVLSVFMGGNRTA